MYNGEPTIGFGNLVQKSNNTWSWTYVPQDPTKYISSGIWFSQNNTMLVNVPTINSGFATVIMKQQPVPNTNMTGTYSTSDFIVPPKNESAYCYIQSLQIDGEYEDPLYDYDEWIFFYMVVWTFPASSACISDGLTNGPYKFAVEVGGTPQQGQWGGWLEIISPVQVVFEYTWFSNNGSVIINQTGFDHNAIYILSNKNSEGTALPSLEYSTAETKTGSGMYTQADEVDQLVY